MKTKKKSNDKLECIYIFIFTFNRKILPIKRNVKVYAPLITQTASFSSKGTKSLKIKQTQMYC